MQPDQKTVLITGASSGLGKAIAEYLVTKNYTVYGTSRNPKQTEINGVKMLPLDVTISDSITEAVKSLLGKEGRIDYLINNAGRGISGPVEEIPENTLKSLFETNYFGPLNLIKAVLPTMREQRSGMIINITSIAGFMGLPFRGPYSASKGALGLTTESMRMELREFGVKLTNVAPGEFATNIAAGRFTVEVDKGSPYYRTYSKSLNLMNDHVDDGKSPMVLAEAVYAVMREENPNVHYKIGALLQRFSVFLKGVLPDKWYERMLMNHYKL